MRGGTDSIKVSDISSVLQETIGASGSVAEGTIMPIGSGATTIHHGLGRIPNGLMIYNTQTENYVSKKTGVYIIVGTREDQACMCYFGSVISGHRGIGITEFAQNCLIANMTEETFDCGMFNLGASSVLIPLISGEEYQWVVW